VVTLLDESLALFGELGNSLGHALGLAMLASMAERQGDILRAIALRTESVELLRAGGPTGLFAWTLLCFGRAMLREGDHAHAAALLEECLAVCRAVGDPDGVVESLNWLAMVALARGNYAPAWAYLRESQALCREIGNTWLSASALLGEGHLALAEGNTSAASACYSEALALFAGLPSWNEQRGRAGVAACLEGLAGAVARFDSARAARLYGATAQLRALIGQAALNEFDLNYALPANRAADQLTLAAVRAALDDTAFDAAWHAGQALTLEQAIIEALGDGTASRNPQQAQSQQ
jgi:tetratricopeptide (TPR) repeat protein